MALKQEEKYLDIFNLFTIEKHSRSLFYDWDLGYTAKVGFLYVKNNNIFVNYKLMTSWNLNGITDALKTFDDFRLLFSLVNHEKKQGYFFLSKKKNHLTESHVRFLVECSVCKHKQWLQCSEVSIYLRGSKSPILFPGKFVVVECESCESNLSSILKLFSIGIKGFFPEELDKKVDIQDFYYITPPLGRKTILSLPVFIVRNMLYVAWTFDVNTYSPYEKSIPGVVTRLLRNEACLVHKDKEKINEYKVHLFLPVNIKEISPQKQAYYKFLRESFV